MDKIKLLTFAVIGLLLLNLSTLGYLIFFQANNGGRPKNHPEPKQIIIRKLHFNISQQQKYSQLISWHQATISDIEQHIREVKNRLYLQLLKAEVDTKTKDSLVMVLGNYQKQIETTHFKHFEDIKRLCNTDQLNNYYDLTRELSKIFSKPPHKVHD